MTALEEIKKAIEDIGQLKVELLLETIEGNAIISPTDDYCGTYFTIIGCGDKQNELGTLIWLAVNKMPEFVSTLESLQREKEELTSGIKRLSDEEELLAETTGDMVSVVKIASKLALSETHVNELQKANVAYVDANTALIRENEALKKDRYDLAYAITGGEDAPGLLDSTPTSEIVEIAQHTHRIHSADIDRAMAAEAEVKRYRAALIGAKTRMRNCRGAIESDQVVDKDVHGSLQNGIRDIQEALASTGGEHNAE